MPHPRSPAPAVPRPTARQPRPSPTPPALVVGAHAVRLSRVLGARCCTRILPRGVFQQVSGGGPKNLHPWSLGHTSEEALNAPVARVSWESLGEHVRGLQRTPGGRAAVGRFTDEENLNQDAHHRLDTSTGRTSSGVWPKGTACFRPSPSLRCAHTSSSDSTLAATWGAAPPQPHYFTVFLIHSSVSFTAVSPRIENRACLAHRTCFIGPERGRGTEQRWGGAHTKLRDPFPAHTHPHEHR